MVDLFSNVRRRECELPYPGKIAAPERAGEWKVLKRHFQFVFVAFHTGNFFSDKTFHDSIHECVMADVDWHYTCLHEALSTSTTRVWLLPSVYVFSCVF